MGNLNKYLLINILIKFPVGFGWADTVEVQLPPSTLSQWYKPQSERQLWLHNMFKLRREMQAVQEYSAIKDQPHLQKWTVRLVSHYQKIAEMVPEWEDELELEWAERLLLAAERGDFRLTDKAVRKIDGSCKSCHREYRAVAAAMYRTPNFHGVKVKDSVTLQEWEYGEFMQTLITLVNQVKIASEDDRLKESLQALSSLEVRLQELGESCVSCHKDDASRERILGAEMVRKLGELRVSLSSGDKKMAGRKLGAVAVLTCASCHGTHRTLYDLRNILNSVD